MVRSSSVSIQSKLSLRSKFSLALIIMVSTKPPFVSLRCFSVVSLCINASMAFILQLECNLNPYSKLPSAKLFILM
ncbi:hypothetical protein MtrunA17_Chr6g0485691 [Medicago truncatula]|uniref:Transmembrane protein n=1 Tax=Medicago truncatula TaxID=3880 RepID=A0A396HHU2_MEDTR|nr:hypothetical protein MtrunA17_Chr6g0485691 [Medicago truncatula]